MLSPQVTRALSILNTLGTTIEVRGDASKFPVLRVQKWSDGR